MQSLAVKYRPNTFEDLTEQTAIRTILENQIKTKTFKHSYLFTGGAGTGKTTCARIFANMLNESQGTPIEIDAASNNGVDNVRDIIDGSKFKSLDSPYKVYIIDECHMLSTGAWNAMLKLLEEPPARTVFIFCTTDPQKVPNTILSRTQRYDFRRISFEGIVERLTKILYWEVVEQAGLEADFIQNWEDHYQATAGEIQQALSYIARLADGGMRDAITLLDKSLSYQQPMNLSNVVTALGTADYSWFLDLTEAILDYDTLRALTLIEEIYQRGSDLKQMVRQYLKVIVDIYKFHLGKGSSEVQQLLNSALDYERLSGWRPEDYQYMPTLLQIIVQLNSDIKWDGNPKSLIEATIVMICQEVKPHD